MGCREDSGKSVTSDCSVFEPHSDFENPFRTNTSANINRFQKPSKKNGTKNGFLDTPNLTLFVLCMGCFNIPHRCNKKEGVL